MSIDRKMSPLRNRTAVGAVRTTIANLIYDNGGKYSKNPDSVTSICANKNIPQNEKERSD